jgi:uncharacterized protein (TIGR03437 family)
VALTHRKIVSLLAPCVLALAGLPAAAQTGLTTILGQPTDRSITINTRADSALEIYFEYGLKPAAYSAQTAARAATADPYASGYFVLQTVLNGLAADTRYYYRMRFRTAGSGAAYSAGAENTFHTQRLPGSSFVFCVQGDSHPERAKTMFDAGLYRQTLAAAAAEQPDFYITSGDDFSAEGVATPYTQSAISGRYTLQLPYLDLVGRSAPVFLGTGNHEETALFNYNLPADANNSSMVAVWAQNARNLYYPSPGPNDAVTGTFYTGNATTLPGIGLLRDYYAWQWGDALFVVIDPYWGSPALVDSGLGGQNSPFPKTADKWTITIGDAQYQWLKQTLEQSTAKWKFVFSHHVLGTGRGGIEIANQYEWGGKNPNGTDSFAAKRQAWAAPIHELFVANRVTVFFQAHDHLYAHQQLDGVTYQELPNPADNTYTAFNADAYTSGDIFPDSGYVKVAVSPASVKVEYVREFLPADEKPPSQVSGTVQFAYTITPPPAAAPSVQRAANAASELPAIAPNTWVELDGLNLSQGGARAWRESDFANGQLPTQIDGVSASVNGKASYLNYAGPRQVNVLTPPDSMSGPVKIRVTVDGAASAGFTAQAQDAAPAFFMFNGGPYIAATRLDGSVVGPPSLYPGLSAPAKPGDTVALYGNGFGATSLAVAAGSPSQSGALPNPVSVQIGGQPATVKASGLVYAGLFEFDVVVPAAAPDGDLAVTASYNGLATQSGVLLSVKR